MTRVLVDISTSLDGYVAGPDQSPDAPLGTGGERLHEWMFASGAFDEVHGGPEAPEATSDDARVVREHFVGVGAYVMGRGMFGGGPGPWSTEPWNGWWGDEPPFRKPVFVVTHHPREPLVLGETTFTFVTDGPEAALALAKEAAGDGDALIGGGASVVNQLLAAGAVDQLQVHLAPTILGAGERLFAGLGPDALALTVDRVIASPAVTHVRYRVGR
jgi:dihydrofolate reductase